MTTSKIAFPNGFVWGSATSGYQTEGPNHHADIWAEESAANSPYTDPSGQAIEHYARFESDIALLASLGLKAYRFSVEWSRVEPREGEFDESELAHYRAVAEACHAHGLVPMMTLHHFVSPKWLMALGGWKGARTPALFARYTERVMRAMDGRVSLVCTINECNIGVLLQGLFTKLNFVPPVGIDAESWTSPAWRAEAAASCGADPAVYCSFQMAGDARGCATIMAAHRAAREAIRRVSPGTQVGLSLALTHVQALPGGERGAAQAWYENFRQWLPLIRDDDFFGLQNYTREVHDTKGQIELPGHVERTQMGYEFTPEAVSRVLRMVARETDRPVYVTENGIATADDARRRDFIDRALAGLHGAIQDGIDLRGYFYWTAFDNWEWIFGYSQTFGLISVDRSTQERLPKPSARHLGRIAEANGLAAAPAVPDDPLEAIGARDLTAAELDLGGPAIDALVLRGVLLETADSAAAHPIELRIEDGQVVAIAEQDAHVSTHAAAILDGGGCLLRAGRSRPLSDLLDALPQAPLDDRLLAAAAQAARLLQSGVTTLVAGDTVNPDDAGWLRTLAREIDGGGLAGPRLMLAAGAAAPSAAISVGARADLLLIHGVAAAAEPALVLRRGRIVVDRRGPFGA